MSLGVQPDGQPAGVGPSPPQHRVSRSGELTVDASSLPPRGKAPAVTSGAEAWALSPPQPTVEEASKETEASPGSAQPLPKPRKEEEEAKERLKENLELEGSRTGTALRGILRTQGASPDTLQADPRPHQQPTARLAPRTCSGAAASQL
ncbi:hypothetical protein CapIbe_008113 [Capra ibex]